MEAHEYARIIRRRWRVLVACLLVAGAAAWVTTPAEPADDAVTYEATHQLIRDSSATAPPALASLSIFVKTGEVPRRVADRIDFDGEPAVLASQVSLEPDETVGTLGITVTGPSPSEAAERANSFAEETLAYLGEEAQQLQQDQLGRLNEQLSTLQVEIDSLDERIADAESAGGSSGVLQAERDSKLRQYGAALDQQQQVLNAAAPSAGYVTLQAALPDLASAVEGGFSPPSSRPARTAIALVVGLLLGLAAVLVTERLDTRLNTADAVQAAFGLPVVAEVPRVSIPDDVVIAKADPASAAAEAYRTLRASLVLVPTVIIGGRGAGTRGEPEVILVTSPAPGDGKTTTVANLATAFAEAGRSVLVMGCDFRRPEVHRLFGVDPRPGISEVLMDARRELASVVRPTMTDGVQVAPSGSALRSFGDVANAGRALVGQARELADVVIIDTAPILATNDATELIPAVDAVVVVARAGKTSADSARRTKTLLERLAAPTAGVVLIGTTGAEGSYADYYTTRSEPAPRRRRVRRPGSDKTRLGERLEPWHGPDAAALRQAALNRPRTGPAAGAQARDVDASGRPGRGRPGPAPERLDP
jgi:capsular exopolysaccharide synthesis family protein